MNDDIRDEINLMDYIQVIRKRKWLIILGTLLCMAVAGVVSFMMPKVYEAKAYLMVTSPKYQVEFATKEGSKISTPHFENISAETFSKIIINEHTARAVIKKNGLDSPHTPYTVNKIIRQIKVEYPRNTNLILLKVQDTVKDRAAQIANTWASVFIERNEEVISKETSDTYNFVMDQLEKVKVSLKTAEEELEKFQKANKIDLLKEQSSGKIKQIVQYENKLDDAIRSQLIEKARYDELTTQIKEQKRIVQPPGNITTENVNALSVGIHDLTAGMTVKEADSFIKQQMENALSVLTKAENEYKEFSQKSQMEILQAQIDKMVIQLAEMKIRMPELEINLEKQRIVLERTTHELEKENQYIPVDKGLIGKEEINPIFISLNSNRANTAINISSLEKEKGELLKIQQFLEQEIQRMKKHLPVQKMEESRLKRQLVLAETNYNALAQKREQSKLSEARDTGEKRLIGYTNIMYNEIKDALMKSEVNIQALNAEILQLKKNIKNLNEEVSGLRRQLAEQELIQTRLIRNVETTKSTFEVLSKKGEETKITSAIKAANVQISVPAMSPESPIKPKKRQNVIIAGVIGLFASVILAFFIEFLEKNKASLKKPV
ncbi:MAG: GNVR domain-containing protein [Candidatus Zixiibacteriota bacterium]